MDTKLAHWEDVVKFHGHSCMGLAMGYRVAEAALKTLQSGRDTDEELVAVVENDSCAVDAVQFITGCTMGKGNLIFRDYGKPVYTFALRPDGKAVRIVAKVLNEKRFPELTALRQKTFSAEATAEDRERYKELAAAALPVFMSLPLEEVVSIEETTLQLPEKARIFDSLICARCGERVMEPRARVRGGQQVCIPCAEQYQRWP